MPTVYTDDLQKLFLEFMITDPELFVRARNIISPVYFSKKYFEAVSMFVEHSEKYQTLPTIDQIKAKCEIELKQVPNIDDTQKQWFLDEFETFCRHKALERAIIDSADLLEKGDYRCFVVMRCWHPRAVDVIKKVREYNPEEIILLPLYPQFSASTSGSSITEWKHLCEKERYKIKTKIVCCYPTEKNFIESHANLIKKTIKNLENNNFKLFTQKFFIRL